MIRVMDMSDGSQHHAAQKWWRGFKRAHEGREDYLKCLTGLCVGKVLSSEEML
jgi:hypothetical protein